MKTPSQEQSVKFFISLLKEQVTPELLDRFLKQFEKIDFELEVMQAIKDGHFLIEYARGTWVACSDYGSCGGGSSEIHSLSIQFASENNKYPSIGSLSFFDAPLKKEIADLFVAGKRRYSLDYARLNSSWPPKPNPTGQNAELAVMRQIANEIKNTLLTC